MWIKITNHTREGDLIYRGFDLCIDRAEELHIYDYGTRCSTGYSIIYELDYYLVFKRFYNSKYKQTYFICG